MNQILKTGDVVVLDGKDSYYVAASIVIDGKEYIDMVKYPDNRQDFFQEEKLKRTIAKVRLRGQGLFVEVVNDADIQEKVRQIGMPKVVEAKSMKAIVKPINRK